MPIVDSTHRSPFYLANGHIATLYPNLFRKVKGVRYERERIDTDDQDFLDLDWLKNGNRKLVIIGHGLEGSSDRHYVKGTALLFRNAGWDVLAWNYRSCGGKINKAPRLYHHGNSDDLRRVVNHARWSGYQKIMLVGYSMGGSTIAKYLGEKGENVPAEILGGAGFSVPCDLAASSRELGRPRNRIYMKRFLKKLRRKLELKAKQYPGLIDFEGYENIRSFHEFDDRYTAPLHHFRDAAHFYASSTCNQFLEHVRKPLLITNARNDPFLPQECYPVEEAKRSEYFHLEMPPKGGHVGFLTFRDTFTWSERRALEFAEKLL